MSAIEFVRGRQVLDSRGNPTVEAEVFLESGASGRAIAPVGGVDRVARGRGAARRRRRLGRQGRDPRGRLVNGEIAAALLEGSTAVDQRAVDLAHDRPGRDAQQGAASAPTRCWRCRSPTAKAAAAETELPLYRYLGGVNAHVLPVPMHERRQRRRARGATRSTSRSSWSCRSARRRSPRPCAGAPRPTTRCARCSPSAGCRRGVGDEGGFAPDLPDNETAVKVLVEAIERTGRAPGRRRRDRPRPGGERVLPRRRVPPRRRGTRALERRDGRLLGRPRGALPDRVDRGRHGRGRLGRLGRADPAPRRDRSSSSATTTSSQTPTLLASAASTRGVANAILIKLNQIGTLTETLDTVDLARRSAYGVVISHRSGETEDVTIADLAVATNAGQIKTGAPARSDRVAKYNQLLRIEESLGEQARFLGASSLSGATSGQQRHSNATRDRTGGWCPLALAHGARHARRVVPAPTLWHQQTQIDAAVDPDRPGPRPAAHAGARRPSRSRRTAAATSSRASSTSWSSPARASSRCCPVATAAAARPAGTPASSRSSRRRR